jgi:hypothetical protein
MINFLTVMGKIAKPRFAISLELKKKEKKKILNQQSILFGLSDLI